MDGYPQVGLSKDCVSITQKVHRLVAKAFIPNPENKPQINHISGVKDDNRVENLEWCTSSENTKHSYDILGRVGKTNMKGRFGKLNVLSKKVQQINPKTGKVIRTYHALADAARLGGFQRSKIGLVCNGKRKLSGGFKWKFV